MRKLETLRGRGALGALLLVAFAACALFAVAGAAQSGRRRTPQQTPPAQPTPEGESESESRPRPTSAKDSALVSFVVMEQDEAAFNADSITRREVAESFAARLGRAGSVSVSGGGRGSRSDARRRAQGEGAAFVVLVALEEGHGGDVIRRRPGQEENRTLVIRTTVFEPKTGAIKYMDTTYQRPVRQTVGVGGIGIPVPTRTMSRYPSQLELRQAAHDAADRLLSRFNVAPPPDQP
jgi:hypothetical protein